MRSFVTETRLARIAGAVSTAEEIIPSLQKKSSSLRHHTANFIQLVSGESFIVCEPHIRMQPKRCLLPRRT